MSRRLSARQKQSASALEKWPPPEARFVTIRDRCGGASSRPRTPPFALLSPSCVVCPSPGAPAGGGARNAPRGSWLPMSALARRIGSAHRQRVACAPLTGSVARAVESFSLARATSTVFASTVIDARTAARKPMQDKYWPATVATSVCDHGLFLASRPGPFLASVEGEQQLAPIDLLPHPLGNAPEMEACGGCALVRSQCDKERGAVKVKVQASARHQRQQSLRIPHRCQSFVRVGYS